MFTIKFRALRMGVTQNLNDLRINYTQGQLLEENTPSNPFLLFKEWMLNAQETETEPNGMVLATVNKETLQPTARVVLLKEYDERGFVFFTNFESNKGRDLKSNPKCALTFWWGQRSVRIEGEAKPVEPAESDRYFKSRPVGSQWGAWTSLQSTVIKSREELEERERQLKLQFNLQELQRPLFWGGYRVEPHSIEFWQGRPNRLHDRIRFTLNSSGWSKERLSP